MKKPAEKNIPDTNPCFPIKATNALSSAFRFNKMLRSIWNEEHEKGLSLYPPTSRSDNNV